MVQNAADRPAVAINDSQVQKATHSTPTGLGCAREVAVAGR